MLARWLHLPLSAVTRHPAAVLIILALVIGLPTSLLPDVIEEPEEGWESPEQQRNAERYNATLGRDSVRSIRRWLDPLLGGVTRPFLDEVELGEGWDFEERPEVSVRMKLPPGSGIARADERARAFEALALGAPTVRRVLTRVSEDGAVLRVLFDDGALDRDEPFALREAMIGQALEVAGMEISVSGLVQTGFYSGLGNVAGLPVEVYGPSYEGLEAVAQTFARRMARDPRVADVDTSSGRYGGPSGRDALRLRWGPDSVVRTSLGAGELTALLRSQLLVETPALYARLEGEPRLPVRLVTAGAEGRDLTQLLGLPLSPAGGSAKAARLDGFAELTTERDPPAIERKDQQYKRLVQVYYRGPHKLGKQAIDRTIRTMTPPPGYRIERPRYSFLTDEMRSDLIWLIAGTLALVYLVIAAVLESWRLAGLVMLSVPLAWVGIALGFLWSGESFGEGAFLGVVLVIGTSVNAGILLADRFRRLRAARPGAPARRLALLALRNRLRPIWTTTLTSVAGVLPLLLLPGAKSFWVGLAITVVGGLLSSALLAPVAMVALLSRKTKAPGKRPGARLLTWEGEKAEGNQISFPAVEGVAARTGCR
jgi:multidrug efflux pump subunit AcrB